MPGYEAGLKLQGEANRILNESRKEIEAFNIKLQATINSSKEYKEINNQISALFKKIYSDFPSLSKERLEIFLGHMISGYGV